MATSINWITGVIFVPRADMTLIQSVPTEIRELNAETLRLELRDLEDDVDGRPWTWTHDHNTSATLQGVTYADMLIIIAPYTITFEDGQYAVNLVGNNNNILEKNNKNQVSVNSFNSGGLVKNESAVLTEVEFHNYMTSYLNKDEYKADLTEILDKMSEAEDKAAAWEIWLKHDLIKKSQQ